MSASAATEPRAANRTQPFLYSAPAQDEGPGDPVIAYDTCLMENYVAASAVQADSFECIDVGNENPVMFLLNDQGSDVDVVMVPPEPQSRTGYGSAILKDQLSSPVVATTSAWSVVTGEAAFIMLVGPIDGNLKLYVSFRSNLQQGDKITDPPVTEADRWSAITEVSSIDVPSQQITGLAAGYDRSGTLWVGVTGAESGLLLYICLPGDPPATWKQATSYPQIQGQYGYSVINLPASPGVMTSLTAVSFHGRVVFATQSLCQMGSQMRLAIGVVSCLYLAEQDRFSTSDWIALNGNNMFVERQPPGRPSNDDFPITLYIDETGGLCAAFYAETVTFTGATVGSPIMEVLLYDPRGMPVDSEDSPLWRARFLAQLPPNVAPYPDHHQPDQLAALMSQSGVASILLLGFMEEGHGRFEWFCLGAQTTGDLQTYTGGIFDGVVDAVKLIPAAPRQRTPTEIAAIPQGLKARSVIRRGSGRGGCGTSPMFMTLAPGTMIPLASLSYDPATTDWLTSVVTVDASAIDYQASAREVMTWSVQLAVLDEKGQPALLTRQSMSAAGSGGSDSLLRIRAWEMIDVLINGLAVTLPSNKWVPVPVTGTTATITVPTLALSGPTFELCTTDGRVSEDDPVVIYCSNSVGDRLRGTEAGDLETPRDRYGAPMLDDEGNPAPILPPQTNSPENCQAVASALQGCGEVGQGSHQEATGWGRRMDRTAKPPANRPDAVLCAAALRADRERPVCFHLHFDRTGGSPADGTAVRATYRDLDAAAAEDLIVELRARHQPLDVALLRDRMGPSRSKAWKRIKRGWGDVTRAVDEGFVELEHIAVVAVDGAVKVAMVIADAVESAATFLYETTLSLVEQVMDVAQMIFAAVEVTFEKLTTWLAWIFAWDDIERSATAFQLIIGDTWGGLVAAEQTMAKKLDNFLHEKQDEFNAYCDEFKAGELGSKTIAEMVGIKDPLEVRPPMKSSAETGGHNVVLSAFDSTPNATEFTGDEALPLQLDPDEADIEAQQQATEDAGDRFAELTPEAKQRYGDYAKQFHEDPQGQLLDTSVGELIDPVQQMVNEMFTTVEDAAELLFNQASSSAQIFPAVVKAPIQVPMLSQILRRLGWRTEFSLLDLMSLAVAVPFTATFKIVSGGKAPFPDDEAVEEFGSWLSAAATMETVVRDPRAEHGLFTPWAGGNALPALATGDGSAWVGYPLLEGVERLRLDRDPVRVHTRAGTHSQLYGLKAKRIGLIFRTSAETVAAVLDITLSVLSVISRTASLPRAFYTVPPGIPGTIQPFAQLEGGGPGRKTEAIRNLADCVFTPDETQDAIAGGANLFGQYGTAAPNENLADAHEELRDSWANYAKWCSILLEVASVGMRSPLFDIPLVNPGKGAGYKEWLAWGGELSFMVLPDIGSMLIYSKKTAKVLPKGPWYSSVFGAMALGCTIYRNIETLSWDKNLDDPLRKEKNRIVLCTWAGNILNKVKYLLGFLNAPKLWLMLQLPVPDSPGWMEVVAPLGVVGYSVASGLSSTSLVFIDGVMIHELDQIIAFLEENPPAASIWAFGGNNGSRDVSSTEYLLGPSKNGWAAGSTLNQAVDGAAAVSMAGTCYLLGGELSEDSPIDTVETFKPPHENGKAMPSWESGVVPALPEAISGATAVGLGGTKLMVVGGQNGGVTTAAVNVFDLNDPDAGWQAGPALSTSRACFGLAVLLDSAKQPTKLYAVGGVNQVSGSGVQVLSSVEVLDLDHLGDGWQPGPALPAPRQDLSLSCVGETLVAAGGQNDQDESLSSVLILVTGAETPTWTQTQALPEPRYGHGAAVLNSTVYIVGGWAGDGSGEITSSCLAADLAAQHCQWLEQPAMSEARARPGVVKAFPGSWG